MRPAKALFFLSGLLLLPSACGDFAGGIKVVSRDGYRAILAFSEEERFSLAVRGEKKRIEGVVNGSRIVKIVRPDLGKVWQFRPSSQKIYETAWSPTEELVPGYPLEARFDPAAYADRFGGEIRRLDDRAHGMHPCERYEMKIPAGDAATIWIARDLEHLPVRIEHSQRDPDGQYRAVSDTQLLDIRVGAPGKLFEPPQGYQRVSTYEELAK